MTQRYNHTNSSTEEGMKKQNTQILQLVESTEVNCETKKSMGTNEWSF